MTLNDEEEIKNLFTFLTQKGISNSYVVPKESLLFGLKNYALGIPKEDLDYLITKITNKRSNVISFDEFKKYWEANINKEIDIKKFSLQIMNLIREIIGTDYTENSQIKPEGMKVLLEKMNIGDNKEEREKLSKELIECIDVDGTGSVGISNLEFLIAEYFKNLQK